MPVTDHTFIIPAFRDSPFLEECIISLKKQTVPVRIQITTSTPSPFLSAIARKHDIEIIVNQNGTGIVSDWNFAYQTCRTRYLTLAHQDDLYLPEYAEKCLLHAEKQNNRDCLIIFTGYREFNAGQLKKSSLIIFVKKTLLAAFLLRNKTRSHFFKRSMLAFGNPVSCPTVMFNTCNIGPIEFSEEYRYNMDWEAWLRLAARKGKFIYINRELVIHRLHGGSQTALQVADKNRLKEEEKIFSMVWNKPIARFLMFFYRFGAALNDHKGEM
jgi:glycosyltransferase involved in cell wall biosynthesis